MSIEIQEIDTRTAPEETLRTLHSFYHAVDAEYLPDDPPTPFERRALDWQNTAADSVVPRWLLTDDGDPVAAGVAWMNLEQNLDNGFGRVFVHPDARGRGHARRLAEVILSLLKENGRSKVDTHARLDSPSEGFAEKLGLKRALTDRRSRLEISELDMGLMESWITRAQERASDYELLFLSSPYPENVIPKFCELAGVMNTAPREDYEMEDWVLTPEMWRDTEAKADARAADIHTCIAVHRPTGEFAGYTTIQTDRLMPEQAWQWDTGVRPEHRNKGLGRWLKAALIERVLAEHPEIDRIDTDNAGSNEPMLAINVAMGFKGILETATWQGDLETAIERL